MSLMTINDLLYTDKDLAGLVVKSLFNDSSYALSGDNAVNSGDCVHHVLTISKHGFLVCRIDLTDKKVYYRSADNGKIFSQPPAGLEQLAEHLQTRGYDSNLSADQMVVAGRRDYSSYEAVQTLIFNGRNYLAGLYEYLHDGIKYFIQNIQNIKFSNYGLPERKKDFSGETGQVKKRAD